MLFAVSSSSLNLLFPIACYGVTTEIPPLKKGVRGIWKFRFSLNTPEQAAGIFIELVLMTHPSFPLGY